MPAALSNGAAADSVWRRVRALNDDLCRDPRHLPAAAEALSRLQARFDQETDEFAQEAAALKTPDSVEELRRQATLYMQHTLEQFLGIIESLTPEPRVGAVVAQR